MAEQRIFLSSIPKTKSLYLIQWSGPVQPAWRNQLVGLGFRIVDYIPENAYLVYGTPSAARSLSANLSGSPQVRWMGVMQGSDKIHPEASPNSPRSVSAGSATRLFSIQLVYDPELNPETLRSINAVKDSAILQKGRSADYYNLVVSLPPASVSSLAQLPDVLSIQVYKTPEQMDERQAVILTGDLVNNAPRGPGYLAWLASKNFTQDQFDASGFVVDVSDSPIDNGTKIINHFALYRLGSLSSSCRVRYARLVGTLFPGGSTQAVDGHGTVDAHIIGGYVAFNNFPHMDNSGFRYGLGVAPFVQVGSSIIFCNSPQGNYTFPDFDELASKAYQDGARISSNSWGSPAGGAYGTDSQNYDRLVRDAQPGTSVMPVVGNQQMTFVFSAGNSGPGATTVGSPGTAKNVITVGAAENVHPFGGSDGSGIPDTGANNANEVISFSSRGPCTDGRIKPDLMAPGTHVTGGAPLGERSTNGLGTKLPGFLGGGVSGGVNGSIFFPAGQEFYTASSGTSQACPGVAGAAALVYQWFINRSWATVENPVSPAMIKAYLINSARYMTGISANESLFSSNQGMGMVNLGMAFDDLPRFRQDQRPENLFTGSGQSRVWTNWISTIDRPFRVTVAWTDAPGSTVGRAYNNNLDLTLENGGRVYRGNVISGQYSIPGGAADLRNNVESIFLPPGSFGMVKITVTAQNINSDGVPGNSFPLDQDFALIAYNCVTTAPVGPGTNKDFFQSAALFPSQLFASLSDSNVETTSSPEMGEPPLSGRPAQNSVWYRWQPMVSGSVVFDTQGSTFDTILAVYRGSTISNLTKIAENNDISPADTTSLIRFQVVAGQQYWLTVAGNRGATGSYTLRGSHEAPPAVLPLPPPANDNFGARTILASSTNFSLSNTNLWATAELGETALAGVDATRSVWFGWTAPSSGNLTLDTGGSDFANVFGIYTGTNFSSLKLLQGRASPALATNRIIVPVLAGSNYVIKVDGAKSTNGNYRLQGRLLSLPAPGSLFFTNRSTSTRQVSPIIAWTAVPGASHYQVELLRSNSLLRGITVTTTNWNNGPALPPSNGFFARVRAFSNNPISSNNLASDWKGPVQAVSP